ncbi:MAG: complex I 51 kDa subunit family protein, partial [Cyclobacteriaceae bacterium]
KELLRHFKEEEIGEMCCLGRCHENSAFHFQGNNYSGSAKNEVKGILQNGMEKDKDHYVVQSALRDPILIKSTPNFHYYAALFKESLTKGPESVLEEIKASGLLGRGGAGYPMSQKLDACKKTISEKKFVVCNADEGDPGSYSDRYLMEWQPHAVLFGMALASYIIGADTAVIYIRAEYPESVKIIKKAASEWKKAVLTGKDIFGSGFDFKFKIIKGAGSYICGEETALLSSIEGQRPEVRIRPPFPTEKGLFQKPTLVNNVETFANLHYIIANGGAAFAQFGTENTTGSKLICLDSHFKKPGIFEVEMGTRLNDIVYKMGNGFVNPVKALHIGGPLGGIVPLEKIPELTIDFETFKSSGFELGHASIVSIPEDFPMIQYLEHLFAFTAHESCGKCFPCRLGSVKGKELLSKANDSDHKIDQQLFDDLLETLELGSLCGLGSALPLPVRNALAYFPQELKPYFK